MSVRPQFYGRRTLIHDFITADEQAHLVSWALPLRPHLEDNGPGRTYAKVDALPHAPPLYDAVQHRLATRLAIPLEALPEPIFGWYLSIISEGGAVHSHIDPAPAGARHLRCNLFLQLPHEGGLPLIMGTPIPVRERSLLAFFPSEERHASQAVAGDRWRIICSFGYLTPPDYVIPSPPGAAPVRQPINSAATS